MVRFALALFLAVGLAWPGHASVTTVIVTKDNQKEQKVEMTLTATRHPDPTLDTVYFHFSLKKTGDFERLDRVELQAKDGDKLTILIPLDVQTKDGVVTGAFHMGPDLAKKCVLRLNCPHRGVKAVKTFEVQLKTYLD